MEEEIVVATEIKKAETTIHRKILLNLLLKGIRSDYYNPNFYNKVGIICT
jgi:hypothetical protein